MIAPIVREAVVRQKRDLVTQLDSDRKEYLAAVSSRDQAAKRAALYLSRVEKLQAQLDDIADFLRVGAPDPDRDARG